MVRRAHIPGEITATSQNTSAKPSVQIKDGDSVVARLSTGQNITVHLHGAAVTSWVDSNGENLWLSQGAPVAAALDGNRPIGGVIPILFPEFGAASKDEDDATNITTTSTTTLLSQLRVASSIRWEYLGAPPCESTEESVKLDFGLDYPNLSTAAGANQSYEINLLYSVVLRTKALETSLIVRNVGKEPLRFKALLHNYLRVADIMKTCISGLDGRSYIDNLFSTTAVEAQPYLQTNGQTHRVYYHDQQSRKTQKQDEKSKPDSISIFESSPDHDNARFNIAGHALDDVVIWSPRLDGKKVDEKEDVLIKIFNPSEDFSQMVCVGIGALKIWQTLEEGETFEQNQVICSADLS